MINRINLILRAKNITAKQFAEEIGIQPSGMSHIMSGRNNPSLEFVSKVIRRYPEIDANWLLMGKGEMYASGTTPVSQPQTAASSPSLGEQLDSEPTLFSVSNAVPSPVPAPDSSPAPSPAPSQAPEEVDIPLSQPQVADSSPILGEQLECAEEFNNEEPAPIKNNGRRLLKILFCYDDLTFEEYRPSKTL